MVCFRRGIRTERIRKSQRRSVNRSSSTACSADVRLGGASGGTEAHQDHYSHRGGSHSITLLYCTRSIQTEVPRCSEHRKLEEQMACLSSLSPTLLIRSFCTAFREVLSSLRLLTMVEKISFSGWDRGSHLVAYFAQYSITLWRDTQYWMSMLARHADS